MKEHIFDVQGRYGRPMTSNMGRHTCIYPIACPHTGAKGQNWLIGYPADRTLLFSLLKGMKNSMRFNYVNSFNVFTALSIFDSRAV